MRFTHALIRDTLYEALPQTRRLELHRRTAETLEEQPNSTVVSLASNNRYVVLEKRDAIID